MVLQFVGDRLTKINAERGEVMERPLQIKSNVELTSFTKKDLFAAGDSKPGVIIGYDFNVTYGEKSGKISVSGTIFALDEVKEIEKLEKQWKKDKKLNDELTVAVLNKAMELSYLSAIPVAKELGLPAPLRMPKFIQSKEEAAKK